MKLVIVEDEPLLAMALAMLLEDCGHEILGMAHTEGEASRIVIARQPDAVLMDIRLTGHGSGLAAARRIRRESQVPIIFCSAYGDDAVVRNEVASMVNVAFIDKPVDEVALTMLLAGVAGRTSGRPPASGTPPAASGQ